MNKVYFISGLGADKRVFSFLDLSFCDPVFVDWIPPLKNESLESYALRLRKTIPDPHPVIVGISFGGMLATEMAKTDPQIKAILLASSKTNAEFPGYMKAAKYFPVYKWIPGPLLKRSAFIVKRIVGRNAREQKKVILDIMKDTDINFVKWAMHAILHWNNKTIPSNIIHIHGTADRILPCSKVRADHIIRGGSHVLPMDQHQEVSALLKNLVS